MAIGLLLEMMECSGTRERWWLHISVDVLRNINLNT